MKTRPTSSVLLAGIIAAVAFLSIPSLADNKQAPKEASVSGAININLDKDSAVQVAEVVLVKVYGEKVLKEKPWKVTEERGIFAIEGTLEPGSKGGVASIQIRKTNAEVVAIIHGK